MSFFRSENLLSMAAAVFGLITLFASSSVLFEYTTILEKEGNYPSFILWVNLTSSPLYLLAAVGLKYSRKWTLHLLLIILITLILSFSLFIQLLKNGEIYNIETMVALSIRIAFTSVLTFFVSNKTLINSKR